MPERWAEDVPLQDTVNAGEAVKLMGISHRTLMKLLEEGTLRRVRHPRHSRIILVPVVDVDEWLKKAGPPIRRKEHEVDEGKKDWRPAPAFSY